MCPLGHYSYTLIPAVESIVNKLPFLRIDGYVRVNTSYFTSLDSHRNKNNSMGVPPHSNILLICHRAISNIDILHTKCASHHILLHCTPLGEFSSSFSLYIYVPWIINFIYHLTLPYLINYIHCHTGFHFHRSILCKSMVL